MDVQNPPPQKGPGDLTKILNANGPVPSLNGSPVKAEDDQRDSAYFSSNDASSKHTSAASFGVSSILSPTGSGYQSAHDKTPSPVALSQLPQHVITPSASASNMSVASMVSPTTPAMGGAGDLNRFDRPASIESGAMQYGDSLGPAGRPGPESRRESVDSRINQRFDDMRLGGGAGGNSPYASHNQSTVSFHQAQSQGAQRTPRPGLDTLAVHRISNGYQPSAERNPEPHKTVKTAPAITGPATGTIARAAEPTKGQAWAFPEEEIQRIGPSFLDSRRSSQFSTTSSLPPGQRRLDDGPPDYARMSADLPPAHLHHHHHLALQNEQLADLHQDGIGSLQGQQPYSRTPELRISHKLAERKRRTEMKELFDQLRDLMPQERGSKASKWEILTKAIAEHQRQSEHVGLLQSHLNTATAEIDMLRREVQALRMEGAQLRSELNNNNAGHGYGHGHGHPPPQAPTHGHDNYSHTPRTEVLPPLRSISNSIHSAPESMTGVQYETPRVNVNGFRQ